MKKKKILELTVGLCEVLLAVIRKEITDSQLEKETRRIHSNSGVNSFERAPQETN